MLTNSSLIAIASQFNGNVYVTLVIVDKRFNISRRSTTQTCLKSWKTCDAAFIWFWCHNWQFIYHEGRKRDPVAPPAAHEHKYYGFYRSICRVAYCKFTHLCEWQISVETQFVVLQLNPDQAR